MAFPEKRGKIKAVRLWRKKKKKGLDIGDRERERVTLDEVTGNSLDGGYREYLHSATSLVDGAKICKVIQLEGSATRMESPVSSRKRREGMSISLFRVSRSVPSGGESVVYNGTR